MSGSKRFSRRKFFRRLRGIARDRRLSLVAALVLVIAITVTSISLLESAENPPFRSPVDVVYWAVVTICSVGYGDITVRGVAAKLLAVVLILSGMLLVSIMTATFASIFTAIRIREGLGLKKVDLRQHVIICGYNDSLAGVLEGLVRSSITAAPDIVLINTQPESVITTIMERFPDLDIQFVSGDYVYEAMLVRASVAAASAVIILADPGPGGAHNPDDRTLLATLAVKSISRDPSVCAEVRDTQNVLHLKRAGADQVVVSGEFNGFLLAHAVVAPGIPQVFREIMHGVDGSLLVREPFPRELVGQSFTDAARTYLERSGALLVGVVTEKRSFNLDTILAGETNAIDTFIRRKFEEAGRSLEVETRGRVAVAVNPGKNYHITDQDMAVLLAVTRAEG